MTQRILFELAAANPEIRFSPYVWRTKMALAHKGIDVQTVPWRFMDKELIAASKQTKVPVLKDGDNWISDSWAIANYLEDTYPDRPSLFGGDSARNLTRFFNITGDMINAQIFSFVALDIVQILDEKDKNYFIKTSEERVGKSLAEFSSNREERLPHFQKSLQALRLTLNEQSYFSGKNPLYADHIIFGGFQWARCVSSFELLAKDDPIYAWRERMLDAYGGLGRKAVTFF